MSRDQWHPQPAVRVLVRLWMKLLAGRWGACGCRLDPQALETWIACHTGDHLQPSPPFSHSLSACFCHRQSANLYIHMSSASLSVCSSSVSVWSLFISLSLAGGTFVSILNMLDEMCFSELSDYATADRKRSSDDNEHDFLWLQKRKAIIKQARGNQTAASHIFTGFHLLSVSPLEKIITAVQWPQTRTGLSHISPSLSTNKQAGQWRL